jgi:hypothetical protein
MIKGKARAKKLGRMHKNGEIFCVEGEFYAFVTHEDEDYYEVEDEMDKLRDDEGVKHVFGHGMIPAFFDEYFDVIEPKSKTLLEVFNMLEAAFDNSEFLDIHHAGEKVFKTVECNCNKKRCPMAVIPDDWQTPLDLYECRLFDYTNFHLCTEDHEDVSNCPRFQKRIKPRGA